MAAPLELTRAQVLAFRRRAGALDRRLPAGRRSLREAAWAGLQDSMPRAALHSIHARVEGTRPSAWEDASLVQVWGPRYQVYVVPARDHVAFTLGRLPARGRIRDRAEDLGVPYIGHGFHRQVTGRTSTPCDGSGQSMRARSSACASLSQSST